MKTMTVIRHRPTLSTDEMGRTAYDYDNTADTSLKALWVGTSRSRELIEGRQTLLTQKRAGFPGGTDIEETDELTAIGQRFRITSIDRQLNPKNPDVEWLVTADLERAE